MNYLWRCIIIPAAEVELTRQIWATLDPEYGNEFRIPLASAQSPETIVSYMTAGWVPEPNTTLIPFSTWSLNEEGVWIETEASPGRPDIVTKLCVSKELEVTEEQVTQIWKAADVTDEPIDTALSRLNLVRYIAPSPEPENL